jgi:sugar phosphate isomerase/epimerase
MHMKNCFIVSAIIGMLMAAGPLLGQQKLNNVFYAQNTLDGFQNAPKTPKEKAKLLKSAGFDGLEGFGYLGFHELREALRQEGLSMPVNYVGLDFNADGKIEEAADLEIKEMIRASARGSVIYFHLHSKMHDDDKEAVDQLIAGTLRGLADYAAGFGVKLCVYPHAGFYCETIGHSVKLAKMVDRKNYGAALNLCHLLKVEGSAGIDEKIRESAPYLFAVNICGADNGDTRNLGWDRLIQPLGDGSFDTYHFVKTLRDHGYTGPVGLQCYNLRGDADETLSRSMKTWKDYQKRYARDPGKTR